MDELLTADEAAKLIGISSRSVRRYAEAGQIEQRRVGRKVLFVRASVEDYARDNGLTGMTATALAPSIDMVSAGEMLNYIRDRDNQLAQLQGQLNRAAQENGKLSTLVDVQARQLQDTQAKLQDAESTIQRLLMAPIDSDRSDQKAPTPAEPEQRRSWWQRLIGR